MRPQKCYSTHASWCEMPIFKMFTRRQRREHFQIFTFWNEYVLMLFHFQEMQMLFSYRRTPRLRVLQVLHLPQKHCSVSRPNRLDNITQNKCGGSIAQNDHRPRRKKRNLAHRLAKNANPFLPLVFWSPFLFMLSLCPGFTCT